MKPNEPIAWNIRRTVRRALMENALNEATVNVTLGPVDWDDLLMELGPKCEKAIDQFDGVFALMYSAGRAIRVFCKAKQEHETLGIALTAELSPEVFA